MRRQRNLFKLKNKKKKKKALQKYLIRQVTHQNNLLYFKELVIRILTSQGKRIGEYNEEC